MAKNAGANVNNVNIPRARAKGRYSDSEIAQALTKAKGLITIAAQLLGCSSMTIRRRLDVSADLRTIQADAREGLIDLAELALEKAIRNGESWAVALALKTLGKTRGYVERQEVTGADGAPLMSMSDVLKLTEGE